jgi:hypothetical protein
MIDVKIVVPSHRRAKTMPRLMSLLPSAFVTVNYSEVDEYSQYVDPDRIIPHPEVGGELFGIGHIRHWIMENVEADYICQCDDDVRRVYSKLHPSWKKYEDGDFIERLVQNAAQILEDLDLPLYGFSSNSSPIGYTNCMPFRLSSWVGSLIVINKKHYGSGKAICYDKTLNECEDGDLALQAFLNGRVVIKDDRFDFDYGKSNGNEGGLQGQRTRQDLHKTWYKMKQRWKSHWGMSFDSDGNVAGSESKVINVARRRTKKHRS